jgi:basic amino acid/polyamine antiporter, APA family
MNVADLADAVPDLVNNTDIFTVEKNIPHWQGRASIRSQTVDYLPLVGQVWQAGYESNSRVWSFSALGSKGYAYAPICSELLVGLLCGEILPLANKMAFVYGDPVAALTHPSESARQATQSLAWLGAIGPIAFSFDGWVVSTSISGEIKHAKRNLPIALVVAPILILLGYLLYFVGLTAYLGAAKVMALGDESVYVVATQLFGETAAKAFLVFVVISVMGTVNGLVLGLIRLPHSLARKSLIPFSAQLRHVSPNYQLSVGSALLGFALSMFWAAVHYAVMKSQLLGDMDISEIAIVVSYLLYLVFYFAVFRLWQQGHIKSMLLGVISPILAALGSLMVVFGGMQNPLFLPVCLPICAFVLLLAYFYSRYLHSQ